MVLTTAALTVFILSAAALFYTYVGYPVLVYLVSVLRTRDVRRGSVEPDVTVIITAYGMKRTTSARNLKTRF